MCTRDVCAYVLTPLPDSMVLITDKFWGPSGAENAIGSVHMWLAEAINALQDNKDTLTAKVCEDWERGLGGRHATEHWEDLSPVWPSLSLRNPAVPPEPLWYLPRSSRPVETPRSIPMAQGLRRSVAVANWHCRRSPPQGLWKSW